MAERNARRRSTRTAGRILVRVAIGVLAAVAVVWNRDLLTDAARIATRLDSLDAALLLGCWVCWLGGRSALQRWSLPSATWFQGVSLAEVDAAAHLLPAGGLGSFAARLAVGRTLGQPTGALTVSFVLISEALATALWGIVLVTSARDLAIGSGDGYDVAGLVGALIGLVVTAVVCWVVVRPNRVTDSLVLWVVRVQRRMARRFPRVDDVDVPLVVGDARRDAARLIGRRGVALVAFGVAVHATSGLILWTALEAVGADGGGWASWNVYALVTAAVGFAPTPAGVGFAEGGLTVALAAIGTPLDEAAAAVVIHRGLTLLLPVATGGLSYMVHVAAPRRTEARGISEPHRPFAGTDEPPVGDPSSEGVLLAPRSG